MTWKITEFTDPWPHLIIDGFFPRKDFEVIREDLVSLDETINENLMMFESSLRWIGDGKWRYAASTKQDRLWFEYPAAAQPTIDLLDEQFFLDHFPRHRKYETCEYVSDAQISQAGSTYWKHCDAPKKIMSTVVYIAGHGGGTLLHDADGNFVKEIPWRANRAIVFAPIDGLTWHSYNTDQSSDRITITQNILRTGSRPD